MPQNCSADVEAVISYVTEVISNGTAEEKHAVKANWGLGSLSHDLDFLGARKQSQG
jgi:hypothetical protein